MAAWNVVVGALSVVGILAYVYLGCDANENTMIASTQPQEGTVNNCNANCQCDYVKYTPVCGNDGLTYISPCHAGCTGQTTDENGRKVIIIFKNKCNYLLYILFFRYLKTVHVSRIYLTTLKLTPHQVPPQFQQR